MVTRARAIDDPGARTLPRDRKSTRNSSHANISYAVFCLKKKKILDQFPLPRQNEKITRCGGWLLEIRIAHTRQTSFYGCLLALRYVMCQHWDGLLDVHVAR